MFKYCVSLRIFSNQQIINILKRLSITFNTIQYPPHMTIHYFKSKRDAEKLFDKQLTMKIPSFKKVAK